MDETHTGFDSEAFAIWRLSPAGNFPIAVLSPIQVQQLNAKTSVVVLSPDTMRKQIREHPELVDADYALIQTTIANGVTSQDTDTTLRFVLDAREIFEVGGGGQVVVVKATKTGESIFVTSMRRLSRNQAKLDREIRRLLG
jgi:hypothetical protein